MLMNRDKSVLLIVDVQARLAPYIHDGQQVAEHCAWLAQVAERVGVPVVVTEHFPEKIGGTWAINASPPRPTAASPGQRWISAGR